MTPFGSTAQMPDPQALEARPAVARIAAFAVAARPERLTPEIRQLFKRNILDRLACAIAALPGRPFAALRDQFEEYRAPGRCTLIGGGKTSLDQAALFNSGLTRYVDLLDSYCRRAVSLIRATVSALSWLRRNMWTPPARTSCSPWLWPTKSNADSRRSSR